jgi:hypothetical protein
MIPIGGVAVDVFLCDVATTRKRVLAISYYCALPFPFSGSRPVADRVIQVDRGLRTDRTLLMEPSLSFFCVLVGGCNWDPEKKATVFLAAPARPHLRLLEVVRTDSQERSCW